MPEAGPHLGRESLKLLVVEDSDDDYALLTHHLKQSGFRFAATRVVDAAGLAAALRATDWDLVISDHQLPGFSSTEALAMVRAARLPAPFIIVSGAIGEALAVDAMLSGADDYVMKGKLGRLVPAIERGLRASAERRRREASEARLAAVAQNLPGVLLQIEYGVDTGLMRLPYLSEGTQSLFGASARELMADPALLSRALHPGDLQNFLEHIAAASREHTALDWQGRVQPRADEAPHWILVAASPRPGAGKTSTWDGLAMDITAQKQIEEEVRGSRAALRTLSAHLERVKEAERSEISRELHDEIGGLLTGLKVDLAGLARQPEAPAEMRTRIEDMNRLTDAIAQCTRRIAKRLRPAILDQSLPAALDWLARDFQERTGIRCSFTCNDEDLEVSAEPANAAFRVVQESLTNVMRHANAQRVEVQLFASGGELSVEVRDDGVGLGCGARGKADSFGLRGMEERVASLGGWLDLSSAPGKGTTVMFAIPLKRGAP